MKFVANIYRFEFFGLFLLAGQLVLLSLFMQSCVREQMDDCVQYELTVSAVDTEGEDITSSGAITSIDLYLFDENGFLRIIPQGSSSSNFLLGTEKDKALTLVAWGNLKSDSLILPELSVGTSLEDAKIELLQTAAGYDLPVTDLFYSRREISSSTTRGVQSDTIQLVMERLAAALSVRVSHAAEHFGSAQSNLHIVVRGTGTSLNFLGEPSNDEAGYAPAMEQVTGEDEWVTPLFRVFPTGESDQIYIDLYQGDTFLFTISTDDGGSTLRALPGTETYVTVDFRYSRLHISVSVEPWESTDEDVEL
ncbi:MAG: Fimbrillin-A associated anchor protein Mfa1 and Mfa2 [Bacteroidetes bacterium]|jgi:hypothetical protein|nr:Fimbrillin-A associated anchor protein Mfa1 and Mfa2 [Bacteroidota bacterium]